MSGVNITVYDGKSAQLAAQRAEAAAASAKQSADQATSQLMDPIAPGTEQNPTVLPDGPDGEVRRIEDVLPGHYIWGTTPFSVPEGSFGTFYWLRTSWSLTTQELPQVETVADLDSTDNNKALAASQGRVLRTRIEEVEGEIPALADDFGESTEEAATQRLVTEVKTSAQNTAEDLQIVDKIVSDSFTLNQVGLEPYDLTGKIEQGLYDLSGDKADDPYRIRVVNKIRSKSFKIVSTVFDIVVSWFSASGSFLGRQTYSASQLKRLLKFPADSSAEQFTVHFYRNPLVEVTPDDLTGVSMEVGTYLSKAIPAAKVDTAGGVLGVDYFKGMFSGNNDSVDVFTSSAFSIGGYIEYTSGEKLAATTTFITDFIQVKKDEHIELVAQVGSNAGAINLYRTDDFATLIDNVWGIDNTLRTYSFTVKEDGYVVLSSSNSGSTGNVSNSSFTIRRNPKLLRETDVSISPGESKFKYINEKTFYNKLRGFCLDNINNAKPTFTRIADAFFNLSTGQIQSSSAWEYYIKQVDIGDKYAIKVAGTYNNYPAYLFSSGTVLNNSTILQSFGEVPEASGSNVETLIEVNQIGYLVINNRNQNIDATIESVGNVEELEKISTDSDAYAEVQDSIVYKAKVVSDWENEIMAHDGNMIIDDDGVFYLPYYGTMDTVNEYPEAPGLFSKMSYWNISDPNKITHKNMLGKGEQIGELTTHSDFSPYVPYIFPYTGDNTLLYCACLKLSTDTKTRMMGRYWDKSTEDFTGGLVQFNLFYQTESGSVRVDFNEDGIAQMVSAVTGSVVSDLGFTMLMARWKIYNGEYYTFFGTINGGTSGVIVKTSDGVNYNFVALVPTGRTDVWEGAIEIVGNYIYVIVRGSGKMFKYNIDSKVWTTSAYNVIEIEQAQRHCMFYKDNALYIMYNIQGGFFNNHPVPRSRVRISKIEVKNMEVIKSMEFSSPFSFQYYGVCEYRSTWWMYFTEDRRNVNPDMKGNISVIGLNDVVKI